MLRYKQNKTKRKREDVDCQEGVALKKWSSDYSNNWRSSYCSSRHHKLNEGYIECMDCTKIVKPTFPSHTHCLPCWKYL